MQEKNKKSKPNLTKSLDVLAVARKTLYMPIALGLLKCVKIHTY